MAAIFAGTIWGIVAGNLMKGVILGTAAGAVVALLVWLLDRSRS